MKSLIKVKNKKGINKELITGFDETTEKRRAWLEEQDMRPMATCWIPDPLLYTPKPGAKFRVLISQRPSPSTGVCVCRARGLWGRGEIDNLAV